MENADFDPAETIAGFPLLSIKRALGWVGIMDDRDDVALAADALTCSRSQAERLLAALERRGFVTPTPVKNQWKTTPLGWQLGMHWKPPPWIEPAIALEDNDDLKAISEMFDDVPCSILRTTPENDDAFEEARLEVGVFVDYASSRVIEVSVAIPDDYDHPDSSATVESSVYIGVDDAKRFAKALRTAIDRAESELARRATLKPGKKKPARDDAGARLDKEGVPQGLVVLKHGTSAAPRKPAAIARAAAAAEAAKRREEDAAAKRQRLEQRALEATLQELKGRSKRGPQGPAT